MCTYMYTSTGCFAKEGEKEKRDSWRTAIKARRLNAPAGLVFVPFRVEIGGAWGPAARGFFNESLAIAHMGRDIDTYH